jgi:hypothetical protein
MARSISISEPTTEFAELIPRRVRLRDELVEVQKIARKLLGEMNDYTTRQSITAAHVLHGSSAGIQAAIGPAALKLGFKSERKGLFAEYSASGMRPDYYRPVGTSGILMEVERGKTLANNMDLLDLWKCHVCSSADFLFLVVPKRRPRGSGREDSTYARVVKRLETFFLPRNRVHVEAAFIFGY